MVAGHSIDPGRWRAAFELAMGRIASRFARVEPRLRAGRLVLGLLLDLPRKNCWTIAEWAGETSPHGMQHLLCRAVWDADVVRNDVNTSSSTSMTTQRSCWSTRPATRRRAPHGRGPAPVHRNGRTDRELPGRCLPRLRRDAQARGGGPGAVHPTLLDGRPGPLPGSRTRRERRLRDQAGPGPAR